MHVDPVTGIITEFRYFYQMMPVRPLSAHAQAFWFFLLYRANAAFWQFPLQIQLNEIAGALRLSRSSVQRARDELVKQGYVLYEHDAGSRTVRYYLISNVRPHSLMTAENMLAGRPLPLFSVKQISPFSSSEFPIVIVGKSPLSAGLVRKQVPLLHPAA